MNTIIEPNFVKLTSASFTLANANDADAGVGRSMLLNNVRRGWEIDRIVTGFDPKHLLGWATFRPQYEAPEHEGVTSAVNVWYRVCQDNYKALTELWNTNDYRGMVELMENAADPGPINGTEPDDHG